MSDSLRVRLEFKNFSNRELRNSLLSFKKNEIKNVERLHRLIQKRFNLQQNIVLLIDGFGLEPKDSVDVVRDNDLIVIEPKFEVSLTKVKTEVKTEPNIKTEKTGTKRVSNFNSFSSDIPIKKQKKNEISSKTKKREEKINLEEKKNRIEKFWNDRKHKDVSSKEYVSSSSSDSEKPKVFDKSSIVSSENKMKAKAFPQSVQKARKSIKAPEKTESKPLNTEIHSTDEKEVTSLRGIPLRKAFQKATVSIRPQNKPQNTNVNADIPSTSDTPASKKKRMTKEAKEPMDRFTPVIILDPIPYHIPHQHDSEESHMEKGSFKGLKTYTGIKKQSARKSFPNPSRNKSIKDNESENNTKIDETVTKNKKESSEKTIDFENCEPLASIPAVGDLIAFKILTLSSDGNGYESSLFQMGSVLYVNEDTQMVDILLQDVIKRNKLNTLNKTDEQLLGIHSLKINWSTVLEPKLVQRQSEPEFMIL